MQSDTALVWYSTRLTCKARAPRAIPEPEPAIFSSENRLTDFLWKTLDKNAHRLIYKRLLLKPRLDSARGGVMYKNNSGTRREINLLDEMPVLRLLSTRCQ